MTRGQRLAAARTPQQRRALDAAETILEASGFRYLSSQIPGLAHTLIAFVDNELQHATNETTDAADQPGDVRGTESQA